MARHLKVHSSLISQVMTGAKDFTPEQLQEITSYFGLNELESEFLLFLLERDRAGTKKHREYWQRKIDDAKAQAQILSNRVPSDHSLTEEDQAVFYSSWVFSAIRVLTSIGPGKRVEEISAQLRIPRRRVTEILGFLVEKMLVVNQGGLYKVGPQITYLEFGSPYLARHHTNWRLQSIAHAEQLTVDELMYTGPLTISRADFAQVKEEIIQLVRRLSEKVKTTNPEDVACLNIDWFWLNRS